MEECITCLNVQLLLRWQDWINISMAIMAFLSWCWGGDNGAELGKAKYQYLLEGEPRTNLARRAWLCDYLVWMINIGSGRQSINVER